MKSYTIRKSCTDLKSNRLLLCQGLRSMNSTLKRFFLNVFICFLFFIGNLEEDLGFFRVVCVSVCARARTRVCACVCV